MSAGFLAQLRAQPWYPQIAAEMQTAGVPEATWASIVLSESGNPANQNATGDYSGGVPHAYGLFQFEDTTLDPNTALNPILSGQVAAKKLGAALAPYQNQSLTPAQTVYYTELAGWPGVDAALDASEAPSRIANLQAIMAQEATLSTAGVAGSTSAAATPSSNALTPAQGANAAPAPTPTTTPGVAGAAVIPQVVYSPIDPNPNDNAAQKWVWANGFGQAQVAAENASINAQNAANAAASVVPNAISAGITSVTQSINAGAIKTGQVALALAIVAGGFALIASSHGSSDAPAPAPVKG